MDPPQSPSLRGPQSKVKQLSNRLSFRRRKTKTVDDPNVSGLTLEDLKLLSQKESIAIQHDLYDEYQFTADQIAELSGLASAMAIARCYPLESMRTHGTLLVVCGPGNNGRDGLVIAKHLKIFGYSPTIFYPKPSNAALMKTLVHQIESMEIATLSYLPESALISHSYNLVVDAIFGVNFEPPVRDPFGDVLERLRKVTIPIASIDIPSGWKVDEDIQDEPDGLQPECLVSIVAPKKCSQRFRGKFHFLGGRFVPNSLLHKYNLNPANYGGTELIVDISNPQANNGQE